MAPIPAPTIAPALDVRCSQVRRHPSCQRGATGMEQTRFDRLTRVLVSTGSRRQTLLALAFAALQTTMHGESARAGPGCKDVGLPCRRRRQCCSHNCRGQQGKKTCRGHDGKGCQPGQMQASCGGADVLCRTRSGMVGFCNTTTGNAPYCTGDGRCAPCTEDIDCERRGFGKGAACVLCDVCPNGRGCASQAPVASDARSD